VTLAAGTRLGPYEILAPLGAGGMGEVFRARDTRLDREVAVKTLPLSFAADADRLARFAREAKLLAQLNHPNIAQVHGLEETGGLRALVMELVPGPTLAERIGGGPLPLDEALAIARQIADALDAAHEKGIVHRDLKPANVKVKADGAVKVLDFGLAKALEPDAGAEPSGSPNLMHSPTLTAARTELGVILGTAAYMAPEQARGHVVDKRADIWAFGAVLYEMLTGQRAFAGDTVSDTLAAVLRADPDWDRLPVETPPAVRRLLARCLDRDRKKRLHDIGDARLDLDEPTIVERAPVEAPRALPRWLWAAGAALLAAGLVTGLLVRSGERAPRVDAPLVAATILPPPGTAFHLNTLRPGNAVLSRDGTRMVFAAENDEGRIRLWVRETASGRLTELAGTDGAGYPFWSPDGQWIGYFEQVSASLRKVPVQGGTPITLSPSENGKGGSWGPDDRILYAPGPGTPILRVSAAGGTPEPVTELDLSRFNSHRHPRHLADGRHFLYLARSGSPEKSMLLVGSADGGPSRELRTSMSHAEWVDDLLLFVRERRLFAQPFDAMTGTLSGEPAPVVEDVIAVPNAAVAMFSVSKNGLLAYHSGQTQGLYPIEWRTRSGEIQSTIGAPALYRDLAFSPDRRQIAYASTADGGGNEDLWLLEVATGRASRFTLTPGEEIFPLWAPDGRSVYYCSNDQGPHALYRKPVAGSGATERLLAPGNFVCPQSISPDGRWLFFRDNRQAGEQDIGLLDLQTREVRPFRNSRAIEVWPQFSPDGRWVSYSSDESGRLEVNVTSFPDAGRVFQVSAGGGVNAHWRADQRELLYSDLDGQLRAVAVETGRDSVHVGEETKLFRVALPTFLLRSFVPDPDHQKIFVLPTGVRTAKNELHLLVNWKAGLPAR
jgi:Tol biopolymer transport system component